LSQIQGQNYGLLDLVVPSRWQAIQQNPPVPDDPHKQDTVTIKGKTYPVDMNPLTSLAGPGAGQNYKAFVAASNGQPAVSP